MKRAVLAVFLFWVLAINSQVHGATTHTVGGSSGWTDSGVDYTTWPSGQTFTVGDSLVFTYGFTHSVMEVDKTGYDSCNTGNPINSWNGGSTTVSLKNPGSMYFICPTAGHCANGMKLAITVAAASTTPGTSPSPSTTPGTPPSTPTTASPPPPPANNGVAKISNVIVGMSFLVATVLALLC